MNRRKVWFFGLILMTITTIILLISGSDLLTISLNKSNTIPLGTFITWAGMVSLPLSIYFGVKEFRKPTGKFNEILAISLKIILIMGVLWVPISYLLAGNLSFSFSEKETFQGGQTAMKWFWALSFGIGLGAISTLLLYWISQLFQTKNSTVK